MARNPNRQRLRHSWYPLIWSTVGTAAALIALQQLGGNEHGASKTPNIDTMPSYGVGQMQPGEGNPKLPDQGKKTGQLVCNSIFVIKHGDSNEVIVRPVLDKGRGVPFNLESLTANGPQFVQQQEAITDYTVYGLDGLRDGSNTLHDCVTEDVTATQVQDASNSSNKPFVLAGPDSTTRNGDSIAVTADQAVSADYVSFDVTMSDLELNSFLNGLSS